MRRGSKSDFGDSMMRLLCLCLLTTPHCASACLDFVATSRLSHGPGGPWMMRRWCAGSMGCPETRSPGLHPDDEGRTGKQKFFASFFQKRRPCFLRILKAPFVVNETRRPCPPDKAGGQSRAYCMTGARSFTDFTSSPSQAAFFAVPSKVELVLKSSYLPSSA